MTFKINGFKILDTLKELKDQSSSILGEFQGSVQYYETQKKDIENTPQEIIEKYQKIQYKVLRLQELQSAYNLYVNVNDTTLQGLIKLQGIYSTVKTTWESAPKPTPYAQKDVPVIIRVVTQAEVKKFTQDAAREHKQLTSLIRQANAREVDLDILKRKFSLQVSKEDFDELA